MFRRSDQVSLPGGWSSNRKDERDRRQHPNREPASPSQGSFDRKYWGWKYKDFGDATLLYYMTEEAQEGKNAYLEHRKPDFHQYPKRP